VISLNDYLNFKAGPRITCIM